MSSKYVQIADSLRSKILEGTYQTTMQLPTEMEFAKEYNVNRQTVRKSLAVLEEEGLIERRQGSGSYVKGIKFIHSTNIAIVATYINNYIFPSILQDAQNVFAKESYSTMLYCTHNKVNAEREILKNIISNPVSGLIVEGTKSALPNPNIDLYKKLENMNIPVIFIHGSYAALPNSICVSDDNYHGGYFLTNYLLKKGHKKIAAIFKNDDIQGHSRYLGFLSAFRDADLPLPDSKILWYTTEEKIQILNNSDLSLLQKFVAQIKNDVTAIVCYNDEIAYPLINVLLSCGIRVPQDIAVVSFDNSSYSNMCSVKITSLAHGTKHIGRIAAEQLINILNGKQAKSQFVPWVLVEKESS
jgi:GntR family transcriptional regulator of arabinose operon